MAVEKLMHFPAVQEALGYKTTEAVGRACARWGIPIVRLSRYVQAIKESDYALLLHRATVKEVA